MDSVGIFKDYKNIFELSLIDLQSNKGDIKSIVETRFSPLKSHSTNHGEILALTIKKNLLKLVEEGTKNGMIDFVQVFNILDLSLEASAQEHFDANFVFLEIEDLIDLLTITDAEQLFDYLESRLSKLTDGLEPNRGKGLTLLRFCNVLRRRLSKLKNMKTCGRILIFLSSVFPLCDRSGVNQKGDFNVENHTEFEAQQVDLSAMDVVEDPNRANDALYNDFWSLQQYFSDPLKLLESSQFEILKSKIGIVFDKFEGLQAENDKVNNSSRRRYKESKPVARAPNNSHHFFAKYLTSRNLFELELNDPFFRRQFLLQFLIVSHFISQCVSADPSLQGPNKSVQYSPKLSRSQEDWLLAAKTRSTKIMEKISPQSKLFAKLVSTSMSHDKNWVGWKAESCKSYEIDTLVDQQPKKKQRINGSLASVPAYLGNDELTRLWERGSNVESSIIEMKERSSVTIKSLDEMLGELDQQVAEDLTTPLEGLEEEYLLYNQMRFNWLSYRLAVQNNLALFLEGDLDNKKPGKTLLKAWRASKISEK